MSRPSKGGDAPRNGSWKDVLEHITTHDSTPCTTAWRDHRIEGEPDEKRPIYSLQIYDTTPGSSDQQHLDHVAMKIHQETYEGRDRWDGVSRDRLDFYGLAMPTATSQEERVQKCIAHQTAEIAARNATGKMDYFIPGTYDFEYHQRQFFIIDRTEEEWDVGEGGFLNVQYDLVQKERDEDDEVNELYATRIKGIKNLGEVFNGAKTRCRWFYETYVHDGLINEELKQ